MTDLTDVNLLSQNYQNADLIPSFLDRSKPGRIGGTEDANALQIRWEMNTEFIVIAYEIEI